MFSMPMLIIEELGAFIKDMTSYIPPGLLIGFPIAFIENGKYLKEFRGEFLGTLLMIVCTFSAGKWIGQKDKNIAWLAHFCGVITSDYIGGGPQVNPAVTISMWTLGKVSYTQAYVYIAAQLCGGLVAFPLYNLLSDKFNLESFGGPEFDMYSKNDFTTANAFFSEFVASLLLMFLIYIVNWELHFGTMHYIIKQSLTAIGIRALIEYFPAAGPAINPMLATTWNVFGVGTKFAYPSEFEHYYVYWISPFLAAFVASVIYSIYSGDTIFGIKLPIGPIKPQKKATTNVKAKTS